MFGNGLRPQIWQQFVRRFNIQDIAEFYGSTEGNSNISKFANLWLIIMLVITCFKIHYSSLYLIENREIIRVMLPLLTISGRIKILSSRYWNFILFLVMSGCITYFILPLLKFYPSAVEFYAPLTTPVLSKSRNNEVRQPPGFGHNKIISRSIDWLSPSSLRSSGDNFDRAGNNFVMPSPVGV